MRAPLMAAAAILGLTALAPPASAATQYQFTPSERNGVCYVEFPGPNLPGEDKPFSIEFSYRVRDGNLGVTIKVNGWDKAQKADPEKKIPMTLVMDTGTTAPSRSGGYESGFNDTAWAGWGPEPSAPVFALLQKAKTVSVKFDGMTLGPVDLQMKGLAYTSLNMCADEVRKRG
ncbi:MAG: hypothetical protein JWR84_1147 [Caulobacter sp.]|nr:hypothetical protein [Caulobacter sp.]